MKVGSKYVGYGKGVRVQAIRTDKLTGQLVADVVWSSNGAIPSRQGDARIFENMWSHYTEVN